MQITTLILTTMTPIFIESKKAHELNKVTHLPFCVQYIPSYKSFCVCVGGKPIDMVDFIDAMITRAICDDDFVYISNSLALLDVEIADMFAIGYDMNKNL